MDPKPTAPKTLNDKAPSSAVRSRCSDVFESGSILVTPVASKAQRASSAKTKVPTVRLAEKIASGTIVPTVGSLSTGAGAVGEGVAAAGAVAVGVGATGGLVGGGPAPHREEDCQGDAERHRPREVPQADRQ